MSLLELTDKDEVGDEADDNLKAMLQDAPAASTDNSAEKSKKPSKGPKYLRK